MSESSRRLPAYCDAFPRTRALSTPFLRLSACSRTRAFARFHALTHFAPDHTQTAYQSLLSAFPRIATHSRARARLARLSRAYQLVPALAHLRVFMRSCISRLIALKPHIMIRISESSRRLPAQCDTFPCTHA
ncbi:hypothetical protein BD769DRAFT_1666976 [Suillus cothurnatus]|nr:hypothetical protein BD769DRAFT_1666976 [Suillus cothurnatus]